MARYKILGTAPADPGPLLHVKAVPKAAHAKVDWTKTPVEVRVTAPADKGKANEALLALLADALGFAKSRLTLVAGATSRRKTVRID
ncbi:hypothetical protein B5C34_11600 [Pacificimonas flava]|uniref:UPF0235 protein B5C34_11600 n=2 Tax=Pacificimonas TaxID=1960290 RepID=A0A219B6Z0_9SPHN|nr:MULTISPECIES: DUF167 domain-containing protein [Pacificimonas]MBZ6378691.1 DUF167 domain-containing protein [Pacificimonas aurantium]OWV34041.1 hypothetical protein B5C34_11600 [Pacificimonas flava]